MYIDKQGNCWWKGNLHTHTTRSDGHKKPSEAVRLYQKAGYDFLAVTDHWALSEPGRYHNMILIPGMELDTMQRGCWHIV